MTVKQGVVTFNCGHVVCRPCILGMIDHGQARCPLCRADVLEQIPQEIIDESETHMTAPGFEERRSRALREQSGEEGADEIDPGATHIKVRIGARDVGFLRNDGAHRELFFEDAGVSFRVVYRDRRCYLYRADAPDSAVPLNPLAPVCAVLPPPPPIPI